MQGTFGTLQGTFGTIQGTFGTIQGAIGTIRGPFGNIQGTVGTIQGTFGTIHQGTFRRPTQCIDVPRAKVLAQTSFVAQIDLEEDGPTDAVV